VWILFEGFFTVGRKLARQAVLTELFQTLKVIDVTVIGGLAKESVLTVDPRSNLQRNSGRRREGRPELDAENAGLHYTSLDRALANLQAQMPLASEKKVKTPRETSRSVTYRRPFEPTNKDETGLTICSGVYLHRRLRFCRRHLSLYL
jgi:hypothetical protein